MEERTELQEQLDMADTALVFLAVIVISVLLSLWATLRQRQGLELALRGETDAARRVGEVTPIRVAVASMVLGALGYFFCLALRLCREAEPGTDQTSARADLWASALTLSAAALRWWDLTRAKDRA